MVVTTKFIEENYPLHNLVWQNRAADLDALIKNSPVPLDLEKLDPRGRTPLFLATSLSSYDTALVLLKHNANTSFAHSNGWTVVNEAVCSGNPELLGVILKYRDHQRRAKRSDLTPKLFQRLKDTPDFFFEMKWEFTSWIPLMTRMCPANTHRVCKMGSYLRVDSTDNSVDGPSTSSKGVISVIFQGREEGVKMMEIDHSSSQVYSSMILAGNDKSSIAPDVSVYEKSISQRLANPAIISFVNLEKIAFERNKTGIWGSGSDKSERINNYDCKVFAATNVELVTRMQYEHLTEAGKTRSTSVSNLQKVLNTFGSEEVTETQGATATLTKASLSFPSPDREVQIFIKIYGRTVALHVGLCSTIEVVKSKIERTHEISTCEQRLMFEGKQMEEPKSLQYYNVQRESTLHLLPRLRGGVRIKVIEKKGRKNPPSIEVNLDTSQSIKSLKEAIERQYGLPWYLQRVMHNNRILEDDYTLIYYGLTEDHVEVTLHYPTIKDMMVDIQRLTEENQRIKDDKKSVEQEKSTELARMKDFNDKMWTLVKLKKTDPPASSSKVRRTNSPDSTSQI